MAGNSMQFKELLRHLVSSSSASRPLNFVVLFASDRGSTYNFGSLSSNATFNTE